MPKQSPVPDELDQPFWAACNEERLSLQYCEACARFQHPPRAVCPACGSSTALSWRDLQGGGTVYSFGVVHDTPVVVMQPELPYNVAVIDLDEAPGVNMLSHLPGTAPGAVRIGSRVELIFETTPGNEQKVPEWRTCE